MQNTGLGSKQKIISVQVSLPCKAVDRRRAKTLK